MTLSEFALSIYLLNSARAIDPAAIYTITEAAHLARCEYQSIFHAIRNKHLRAGGVGRTPRIKGSDLLQWIERGGRTGRKR